MDTLHKEPSKLEEISRKKISLWSIYNIVEKEVPFIRVSSSDRFVFAKDLLKQIISILNKIPEERTPMLQLHDIPDPNPPRYRAAPQVYMSSRSPHRSPTRRSPHRSPTRRSPHRSPPRRSPHRSPRRSPHRRRPSVDDYQRIDRHDIHFGNGGRSPRYSPEYRDGRNFPRDDIDRPRDNYREESFSRKRSREYDDYKDHPRDKRSRYEKIPMHKDNEQSLYVGNLEEGSTEKDVEELFALHGRVLNVRLGFRDYGFVMMHYDDASRTLEALDNFLYKGRKLKVNFAYKQ